MAGFGEMPVFFCRYGQKEARKEEPGRYSTFIRVLVYVFLAKLDLHGGCFPVRQKSQ